MPSHVWCVLFLCNNNCSAQILAEHYSLVVFHVGGCFTLNKPFMFLLLLFPSILQTRNQEWEVSQLSSHAAQSLHASASPSYKPFVNSVQVAWLMPSPMHLQQELLWWNLIKFLSACYKFSSVTQVFLCYAKTLLMLSKKFSVIVEFKSSKRGSINGKGVSLFHPLSIANADSLSA